MHVPIETVADAQHRAKRVLPKPVYTAIIAGNEGGNTIRGNPEAIFQLYWSGPRDVIPARSPTEPSRRRSRPFRPL